MAPPSAPPASGPASIRLVGGRCLDGDRFVERELLVRHGRIVADRADGVETPDQSSVEHEVDLDGLIVAPGFIDLQINGGYGIDLASTPMGMWDLGSTLLATGVTSFLPTLITSTAAARRSFLRALDARPEGFDGAEPLGAHFEGPMLAPERCGAHDPTLMQAPSLSLIDGWSRASGVRLVTIAPERSGAIEVIEALVRHGVSVFAGHTSADDAAARRGIDAGLSGVTHLFNAMAPMGHRSPNLAGVALTDPRLTVALLVDGIHVDPSIVTLATRAKDASGIVLVTDAVAAMGEPPGRFDFAGRVAHSDGEAVRNDDGTLAGSALTMDRAVRNLVAFTGCSPERALGAATAVPARLIGESDRGHLGTGAIADLVLLDDELQVVTAVRAGRPLDGTWLGSL